jgi:hypothetical protein
MGYEMGRVQSEDGSVCMVFILLGILVVLIFEGERLDIRVLKAISWLASVGIEARTVGGSRQGERRYGEGEDAETGSVVMSVRCWLIGIASKAWRSFC